MSFRGSNVNVGEGSRLLACDGVGWWNIAVQFYKSFLTKFFEFSFAADIFLYKLRNKNTKESSTLKYVI